MFRNVSCNDFSWEKWEGLADAVKFLLLQHGDDVDEWSENWDGGIDFELFASDIRYSPEEIISEFPQFWDEMYEDHLITADDLLYADRYRGDEESLVYDATQANPKLGEEVRQKLIEEGRLEESYRPRRRGQRRITESKKNRFARFGKHR